ncbi:bacteriocin immunity protein [Pseudomonas cichorii]|uniref:Bacteriocin immunity protein n=1 Tax=Pseudomonas lijiangensis TaxID=2995658 RepID=A0ABX8HSC1_9PSED|nr:MULTISPECIES: bacteriocin immunity protein [Pseudomonas syringae group]MBX8502431.1 bacteriocin immunity protein [Pseudomonas lijiangensis]MBX8507379.1 bacteriocin immunity protein [Pseudomonas lijiangensis]MBX8512556.1 bacteriocin immunity protein [Pseudomonas cichorii]MBX8527526.1 bacteriocin immunity protein [Pseudomonas cichorii]MBX8570967.1 bacteriocin immunity protein [Pseudomonas cichorii]
MNLKRKLEDYTEQDFLDLINEFTNPRKLPGKEFERHTRLLLEHFTEITGHPDGSDLIYYPEIDTAQGILETVKKWRAQNGKPGFKAPDDHQ